MEPSGVEVREAGTITEIKRGVVKLAGLPNCILGQLIELHQGVYAFVVGFTETEVLALTLGQESELSVGQRVDVRQQPIRLPVGESLIGRIVSPLGEPLDGDPAPLSAERGAMFQEAPGIMDRVPVERQIPTGIRVLDTMIPLGKGQRELIIGDRMTGKTSLALDAILSQQDQQVICVYCSIGQSQHKLRHVMRLLEERHAQDYTVVVAAPASREASEQFLAPYAACAIGEHFMRQGRDVLVVFDDLSKHAWAYRQLSLLLDRPPGREAYPGDMFYIHAQLMERAGQLNPDHGGGSMTFLPICETQQGDVTGYISSNLISMTDGQIYLSSELFYEGIKPAIDVGLSVSRIGNKVQAPLLRSVSSSLRFDLLQYYELLRLTRFASERSEQLIQRRQRGALLRRLMTQPVHQPMALIDQALLFFTMHTGWLERINEEGVQYCLSGLSRQLPVFVAEMFQEHQPVSPALHAKLEAALEEILRPYVRSDGGATIDAIAETRA